MENQNDFLLNEDCIKIKIYSLNEDQTVHIFACYKTQTGIRSKLTKFKVQHT